MRWRSKPTSIISICIGAAVFLAERGLDMAGVTLSIGWAIVLWAISGLLVLFAFGIAIKAYIWPHIKKADSLATLDRTQLRDKIDTLINDINQFVSERELSRPPSPIGHDEATLHSHWQSSVQHSHYTDSLFVNKFHQRIMEIGYALRKHSLLDEKEWQHFTWVTQPDHPVISWILDALKEYRAKLT